MAKQRIATIKGTFAVPGVSKNKRLYTKDAIAEAVAQANKALESGESSLSMLTHHGARDPKVGDVTATAGRITRFGVSPEGHGTFEAELADTQAGRDVAALVTPDQPFLRGVSMASVWNSPPSRVRLPDGQVAETAADGFTLRGIDFTHNPGVTGAQIDSAEWAEAAAAEGLILESLDEVAVELDEAAKAPYGNVTYADPGYQSDGKKRYPLDTAKHVRAAWAYINQADDAAKYTAPQVERIKSKIKSAASKFDINISEELAVLGHDILEAYASVCLDNGPGTVSVSGFTDDPAQLAEIGQRVAIAALAGLFQLDPDCDGDIDIASTGGAETDDNDMESDCASCGAVITEAANFCPGCGQSVPQAESAPSEPSKEAAMAEDTQTTGAADETVTLSKEDLAKLVTESVSEALSAAKAAEVQESEELAAARKLVAEADAAKGLITESAPGPEATEAAPALTADAVAQMIAEAKAEALEAATDAFRKQIQESGPARRGLVPGHLLEESAIEAAYGDTDLSKASTQDLANAADAVFAPLLLARA